MTTATGEGEGRGEGEWESFACFHGSDVGSAEERFLSPHPDPPSAERESVGTLRSE